MIKSQARRFKHELSLLWQHSKSKAYLCKTALFLYFKNKNKSKTSQFHVNISMFTWKLSEFINVHSLFKLIRFRPLSQLTRKAAPLTWGPHPGGRIPAIEPLLQRRGLMSVKTPHYSTRHLQLWQQQFVWWWKTPTLTLQRTPQHQRNQQWTLPNNGQTCPHCVWMTRLWNWTRLPQVHNHSHADIHSQFNVLPEFFFFFFLKRYHWYRWGDTSSPTSANPWVLRTGCGCRLVYCQSKRRQASVFIWFLPRDNISWTFAAKRTCYTTML